MQFNIRGVIPAIPTYFTDSGEIDVDQIEKVIDFVSASGCSGIAVSVVGGEFYKMNSQERATLYRVTVDHHRNGLPVYAGVSHSGTIPALKLAKEAESAGVDFIIIMPPYYNPLGSYSVRDIELHYERVGGGTSLPFIIQDFNYGIPLKLLKKLKREYSNFAGIKIEGYNMRKIVKRMKEIKQELGDHIAILGGMLGYNIMNEIRAGASGTIPGSSLCDYLVSLFSRDAGKSESIRSYTAVRKILKFEVENMRYFVYLEKLILKYRGITDSTYCRMPFTYPRKRLVMNLQELLKEVGIKTGLI